MTIAAGFAHKDGVLLCADTEEQKGAMKGHRPKIVEFDWKGSAGAFAFAGNSDFALATIQKCKTRLESTSTKDALAVIEDVLDKEYTRLVFKHPSYPEDYGLPFWLLAVIPRVVKSEAMGDVGIVELYKSNEHSLQKVQHFAAIGIGDTFARHIIGPSFIGSLSERRILCLAAYMLKLAKENVPGCSGASQIISLRHDGSIGRFYTDPLIEHLEEWAFPFAVISQSLFFRHVMEDRPLETFDDALHAFTVQARHMRDSWLNKPRPMAITDLSPRD
ncbi:MAG: hypothetical protein ABSG03_11375 [Bryobacteraceae bacterium]|jgi:hypothetical protein